MWTAEKARARYARRRAARECVRCGGGMLPEWGERAACPSCVDQMRDYRESAAAIRARRARNRKRAAAEYAADPDAARAEVRARYTAKKLRGECIRCPEPIAEDSLYCGTHKEAENQKNRDRARDRRAGIPARKPGRRRAPIVVRPRVVLVEDAPRFVSLDPLDDYRTGEISLSEAAVRYIELHNGIDARDVGDGLSADRKGRATISAALRRAVATGRITTDGADAGRLFYPVRKRQAA